MQRSRRPALRLLTADPALTERLSAFVPPSYEWGSKKAVASHDCPKPAIDAFLECYAPHYEVIGIGKQVAVRKLPTTATSKSV